MRNKNIFSCAFVCLLSILANTDGVGAAAEIPHLRKQGTATQLMVDGKPFLVLGGELANTASSSLEYMNSVWPRLNKMNLNTVLVAIAWAWIEPEEGKFDFSLVDGLLAGARSNNQRIIFLWFGSWKNGISSFVPAWIKSNQERFPRVQIKGGKSIEVLSAFSDSNRHADGRAYAAFMRHLREVDSDKRTVIMVQMQNEVGILGDSRDRCASANEAFAGHVPGALMGYLQKNRGTLLPEFVKLWASAGSKASGTWQEVFGPGTETDEIFMAWSYARYLDRLAQLGKAEYPLPVFTNTWIVQPEDKGPGDYPSGGPEPMVLDVWRAGAPDIDFNAPDIYLPNFAEWCARFTRNGNPLFVPESRGDAAGVAHAFYAIGQHSAIGYSPFGIDNTVRLIALRPDLNQQGPTEIENLPLPKGYAILRQLMPLILEHQGKSTIAAALLNAQNKTQTLKLGDYALNVDLNRNRRNPSQEAAFGYGLFIAVGPNEYVVAGQDVQITFTPITPGPPIAGLATVEAGTFVDGRWVPGRQLSGDDVLLNYNLAAVAALNQSGSGLRFAGDGPSIQRVKLYRYR
jgi:hypothetical protein